MTDPNRKGFVIGNWKMYKTVAASIDYTRALLDACSQPVIDVGLAVPFTAILAVAEALEGTPILVGAQNMHDSKEGAFTGEISAGMILEAGARFVLLGHSERRNLFGEDSAFVNRKAKMALEAGLLPVVCIGETAIQRETHETAEVLTRQLLESLDGITPEQMRRVAIAYEPVWAIGTGVSATPEQAQVEHAFCRQVVYSKWGREAGQKLRILYGGSVKVQNAASLMAKPDIDGLLIGGASLDPKGFCEIIQACK